MTKKKILVLALSLAMVAILAVGGSLAYFTDTDSETNTFTIGSVKIALIEQQTDGKGGLEDFDQDKTLMPGTQTDGNAVSKIVTVKNTGKNDAWVWVELKIPDYLVSNEYPDDESKNALHWNTYGYFTDGYHPQYKASAVGDGIIKEDGTPVVKDTVSVADGLWTDFEYVSNENGFVTIRSKMLKPLPVGKISLPCLRQVYMDWRVKTNENGTQYLLPDGTSIYTTASWEIEVNAFAIQADGIDSVDKAVMAYTNNGK